MYLYYHFTEFAGPDFTQTISASTVPYMAISPSQLSPDRERFVLFLHANNIFGFCWKLSSDYQVQNYRY